ncbi:hypothetical protein TanjilG_22336 [Lupinus angustifolius]|uniref:Histone-lysine N-methyltransferase n=1 Tax=Lupinus angustifolius TaxID=3871 RepID=A0A1J7FN19_LUPAN|nr:PREDICTED: histone-lysine N-methyltransferase, H3 lysine-9 specific SUVH1-like [Lupinus angustifolius]OIV89373.1 hypothetical protein TanjilG_22336 [Lupinus angustifolius]
MKEGLCPSSFFSSGSVDKRRIIEVKPLRSLAPLIPKSAQGSASGFSPFIPIGEPREAQAPPVPNAAPIRSFKKPTVEDDETPHRAANGHIPSPPPPIPNPTPLRSYRSPLVDEETPYGGNSDTSSSVDGLNGHSNGHDQKRAAPQSQSRKSSHKRNRNIQEQDNDGGCESVNSVLMTFDSIRRRLCQLEDANQLDTQNAIKRADLRANNAMTFKGIRTNSRKRVGAAPGVEIGDIFFFRIELCLVGLHGQSMSGIDYVNFKCEDKELPVALSIVSSGVYDDDAEDNDILIYSGQGEHFNKKDKHIVDQKLQRGNLALDRSSQQHNEVRVIRGLRDVGNKSVKIYVYDGLYRIEDSWTEKGQSGGGIFKYKFVRLPGQPSAFANWKMVQKWKAGLLSRSGLILADLSTGVESIPVSLINDVDNEKGPAFFTYLCSLRHTKPFCLVQPSHGCNCSKACVPGDPNCSCIQRNGGDFPYIANGILVSRKQMIYECGPMCQCLPNCKNRVSQSGLKLHMEVFKTKDRGWGLRSLDPIRAGTFICEYAGEVIDKANVSQNGNEEDIDEYVFDTSRIFEPFKWNYEPSILEEVSSKCSSEDYAIPSPLIISARNVGNVARFMNHSCSPNVFWQPVLYEENNQSFLHIAFFALRHISPLTELTYDYGIAHSEGSSAPKGSKKCLCGSSKCRGSFC